MLRPFSQMEEVEVAVDALVSPLLALRIKILHLAIRIRKLHLSICIFSCWVRIAIVLLLFLASTAIQPKPFPFIFPLRAALLSNQSKLSSVAL